MTGVPVPGIPVPGIPVPPQLPQTLQPPPRVARHPRRMPLANPPLEQPVDKLPPARQRQGSRFLPPLPPALAQKPGRQLGPARPVKMPVRLLAHLLAVPIAARQPALANRLLRHQLQRLLHHHPIPEIQMRGIAIGPNQLAKAFRANAFGQPAPEQQGFQLPLRRPVGNFQTQPLRQRQPVQRLAPNHILPVAPGGVFGRQLPSADGAEQRNVPRLNPAGAGAQLRDNAPVRYPPPRSVSVGLP